MQAAIQPPNTEGTTYTQITLGSAYTIQSSDINGNHTLSINENTFENHTYYQDGRTIEFYARLTDAAGNMTVGSKSSDDIVIDVTAPTVSNVTSTDNDGTYKLNDLIHIDVVFDEAVDVTGTPQLTLETGTNDAVVGYSSGTGTTTLLLNIQ